MSAKSSYPETVFPIAFGNELERGIVDDVQGYVYESFYLAETLEHFTPPQLAGTDDFLTNGAKIYVGGANEGKNFFHTNIETATPECSSPYELVRYMRAADFLMDTVCGAYVKHVSDNGFELNLRKHLRVVDAEGSRKGCHDNFGLSELQFNSLRANEKTLLPELRWHLATRSFVTGAMYVRPNKLHFAQKIGGLSDVAGYGYIGTMYRTEQENGTPRIEVRCSDPNISDWASWIRIGSSALVLALMQTPLGNELKVPHMSDLSLLDRAKEMNRMHVDEDGELVAKKGDAIFRALDFQEKLADLSLDKLQLYVDELPMEYFQIASELKRYCEDVRLVLAGEMPTDILADRADWAAKLGFIQKYLSRPGDKGQKKFMGDYGTQAVDMKYDMTAFRAVKGALEKPVLGYGYKRRQKGGFRKTVPDNDVLAAHKKPPYRYPCCSEGTRLAALSGNRL